MIGRTLGPYRVVAKLGEGGMGEVYRARDDRLGRDVALKILPVQFANDQDRLARFRREAQLLASLNHPNIAQIHGLEDDRDVQALVMEVVEGPTLADRIARAPLPLDDVLPIARQIAEALDAAHEQGIVHRDLKPANVKVREDGAVKVLDFGLAKATEPTATSVGASHSPTLTSPVMTEQGMILGTAAYMSPEQARGQSIDRRTDVWAFGCVLFEMLAGRRAFEGTGVADTLAAVLRSEPDWTVLPAETPPAVRTALRRCFEKDRKRRVGGCADVLLLIDELSNAHAVAPVPARAAERASLKARVILPLAASIAGAALAGAIFWSWLPTSVPPAVKRLAVVLPDGGRFSVTGRTFIAISPDASRLVYVANQQLYMRRLDELAATPVPGTTDATSPFFSPDGQQIGFWQAGQLKKVAVTGGAPQVICAAVNPFGVSWASDGTIFFGQGPGGISQVSADGGPPSIVIPADENEDQVFYGPELLPDGRTVLFTLYRRARSSVSLTGDDADVVMQNLDTGERTVVVEDGAQGRFLSSGHVVFARQGTLWASRFDPDAGSRARSPVSMVEGIFQAGTFGAVSVGGQTGSAQFAVSAGGMLAYVEAGAAVLTRSLVWVDREGREAALPLPERSYGYPRIAPGGQRVAIDIRDEAQDVWVFGLGPSPSPLRKLTFDPAPEIAPMWTPDGERIVFLRSGRGLFSQRADGTGIPEELMAGGSHVLAPSGATTDFRSLVVTENTEAGWSVKLLDVQDRSIVELLPQSTFNSMNASLSADGRWLAYEAVDSGGGGREGIYVRPFPDVEAGLWQIACQGCTRPAWAPSGRELFFLSRETHATGIISIWTVPVATSPSFHAGTPRKLFEGPYFADLLGRTYDVSPDGDRFLMVRPSATAASTTPRIIVVDNWIEELTRLVPPEP